MSTNIKELKQRTKQDSPKIESEKVSRLLELRYKAQKVRDDFATKIDALAVSLDPRANQEAYLRRRQRLEELIEATRAEPARANLNAVKDALAGAAKIIIDTDKAVSQAQSRDARPDYGGQRDLLAKASDKLESALSKAQKHFDKADKDNPDLALNLEHIGQALANPQLPASDDKVKLWREQYAKVSTGFYGDQQPDKIFVAVKLLYGNMKAELDRNSDRIVAIKQTSAELTQRALTCGLPIDQVAPVTGVITRAWRETVSMDLDTAEASLQEAATLLPVGPIAKAPTMDEVETARAKLKRAAEATLSVKPGTLPPQGVAPVFSEPGRKRVVGVLDRLDALAPLCQQTEAGVAVEAMRRVTACATEFKSICDADKGIKDFLNEKQSHAEFISAKIKQVREALGQSDAGPAIQLQARLADLESSFKSQWPPLMTAEELESSGVLLKATSLAEDVAEWKKGGAPVGPQGWQQEFFAASDRLRQVTEDAKQKNVGLLKQFGLVSTMPALVLKGGSLIAGGAPGAQDEVQELTKQLMQTVNVVTSNLERINPGTLDGLVKEGDERIEALTRRIDEQVKALEKKQPGKASKKAKNFVKFFASGAFGDDAERELRISYGAGLKDKLDGLGSMLRCKDLTAVQAALDEIKEFEWKVRDFEQMGDKVTQAKDRQGSAPPSFAEVLTRLDKIKQEIEQQTGSNLKTRPDTLKGWTTAVEALTEELGDTDPRELMTRISALERDIVDTTQNVKGEVNQSKVQLTAILQLLIRLKDAGKKGSQLVTQFGPLLAELNRKGEAMRAAVQRWEVADAGFEDWKHDIESLLNGGRPAEETEQLTTRAQTAGATDRKVAAARKELLKLRDADLKLWQEKFETGDDSDRKKVLMKLVQDLTKETDRGIESLAENRDADGALALAQSVRRELSDASIGQGDKVTELSTYTAFDNLPQLDAAWRVSVGAVSTALDKLEQAIAEAAKDTPGDDVAKAVAAVRETLVRPVLAMFGPGTFIASIKGLRSKDATVRAKHREAALAEVRRIRRVLEGDARVRMLALDNPFKVSIPFSELSSRLFDIEVNVTRARG